MLIHENTRVSHLPTLKLRESTFRKFSVSSKRHVIIICHQHYHHQHHGVRILLTFGHVEILIVFFLPYALLSIFYPLNITLKLLCV